MLSSTDQDLAHVGAQPGDTCGLGAWFIRALEVTKLCRWLAQVQSRQHGGHDHLGSTQGHFVSTVPGKGHSVRSCRAGRWSHPHHPCLPCSLLCRR
jgi:hypothetical protein